MKILGIIICAIVLALTGAYMLHVLHNVWGVALIIGALCVAFPANIQTGTMVFKKNAGELREVMAVPVILDAKVDGERKTDPQSGDKP